MEDTKFVHVSEAITSAILEREQVHPVFLHRNPDNTFKAVFAEEVTDVLRGQIEDADDTILVFDPDEADAKSIYFGFIDEPTDYS